MTSMNTAHGPDRHPRVRPRAVELPHRQRSGDRVQLHRHDRRGPQTTGADSPRATWKLNGTLRVRTADRDNPGALGAAAHNRTS